MHDPLHVVFSIRRPFPRDPLGRAPRTTSTFGLGPWALRDEASTWRRKLYWRWPFFALGRVREWYFPAWVTIWHRDPEKDGSDSSCMNAARRKRQQAIKEHRYLAAWFWDLWWRHCGLLHVHHWTMQLNFAQELRRRLLTRCGTCGGRHHPKDPVNFHVVVDPEREKSRRAQGFRERWLTGEANLHHARCSGLAGVRATKQSLPAWLESWGDNEPTMRMQREREPFYGCYPWWREAILGEDPETAELLARGHVQRSCQPCDGCDGERVIAGAPCEVCDGTGHEPVENPIPAEVV